MTEVATETPELSPEEQAALDAQKDAETDETPEENSVTVIPTDDPEATKAAKALVTAQVKDAEKVLNDLGKDTRPLVEALGKVVIGIPDQIAQIARKKLEARMNLVSIVESVADGFKGQQVVIHDWAGNTGHYNNWARTYVDDILDKAAPKGDDGNPDMATTSWLDKTKRDINKSVTDQMREFLTEHDLLAEAEHIGLDLRTNAEREAERRNRQKAATGGGSTQRGVGSLAETAEALAKDAAPERVIGSVVALLGITFESLSKKDEHNRTGLFTMTPQARRELIQHLATARGSIERIESYLQNSGISQDGKMTVPQEATPAPSPEPVTA